MKEVKLMTKEELKKEFVKNKSKINGWKADNKERQLLIKRNKEIFKEIGER